MFICCFDAFAYNEIIGSTLLAWRLGQETVSSSHAQAATVLDLRHTTVVLEA
jgi:hypothetical protein